MQVWSQLPSNATDFFFLGILRHVFLLDLSHLSGNSNSSQKSLDVSERETLLF